MDICVASLDTVGTRATQTRLDAAPKRQKTDPDPFVHDEFKPNPGGAALTAYATPATTHEDRRSSRLVVDKVVDAEGPQA
jgi:hypothetical protein